MTPNRMRVKILRISSPSSKPSSRIHRRPPVKRHQQCPERFTHRSLRSRKRRRRAVPTIEYLRTHLHLLLPLLNLPLSSRHNLTLRLFSDRPGLLLSNQSSRMPLSLHSSDLLSRRHLSNGNLCTHHPRTVRRLVQTSSLISTSTFTPRSQAEWMRSHVRPSQRHNNPLSLRCNVLSSLCLAFPRNRNRIPLRTTATWISLISPIHSKRRRIQVHLPALLHPRASVLRGSKTRGAFRNNHTNRHSPLLKSSMCLSPSCPNLLLPLHLCTTIRMSLCEMERCSSRNMRSHGI